MFRISGVCLFRLVSYVPHVSDLWGVVMLVLSKMLHVSDLLGVFCFIDVHKFLIYRIYGALCCSLFREVLHVSDLWGVFVRWF